MHLYPTERQQLYLASMQTEQDKRQTSNRNWLENAHKETKKPNYLWLWLLLACGNSIGESYTITSCLTIVVLGTVAPSVLTKQPASGK